MYIFILLKLYVFFVEYFDIFVGLLRANMIGRLLKVVIFLIIFFVNVCGIVVVFNNN